MEYCNYCSGIITNDARCTYEIKPMISMAKATFNTKKTLCHQQIGIKCKEETSKVLHMEYSFVWC